MSSSIMTECVEDQGAILDLHRALDEFLGLELREKIKQLLEGGRKFIILDLSQVADMDRPGYIKLILSFADVLKAGGNVGICCPSEELVEYNEDPDSVFVAFLSEFGPYHETKEAARKKLLSVLESAS